MHSRLVRLRHDLWHSPAAASGRDGAGLFCPLQHKGNQTTLLLYTTWSHEAAGVPNDNTLQEALGIACDGNSTVEQ